MKSPVVINIHPINERHAVTFATVLMIAGMLLMAREDPELWEVELFKTLLTAISITGFLNMVMAFHFAANKGDEAKTENTGAAFRAIEETAKAAQTTTEGPIPVEVTNTSDNAVQVEETKP